MQAGEDVLGLVRRTRAHPSYADCYTLPSYGKCWRRAAGRGRDRPAPPRTPARRLSCSAWTGVHTARSQQV